MIGRNLSVYTAGTWRKYGYSCKKRDCLWKTKRRCPNKKAETAAGDQKIKQENERAIQKSALKWMAILDLLLIFIFQIGFLNETKAKIAKMLSISDQQQSKVFYDQFNMS